MGYNINYWLTVSPEKGITYMPLKEVVREWKEGYDLLPKDFMHPIEVGFDILSEVMKEEVEDGHTYILGNIIDGGGDGTWRTDEVEMKRLSALPKYKDVLFTLHGEGEDTRELFYKYFKNGKMQVCRAEITYPEFSEDKFL